MNPYVQAFDDPAFDLSARRLLSKSGAISRQDVDELFSDMEIVYSGTRVQDFFGMLDDLWSHCTTTNAHLLAAEKKVSHTVCEVSPGKVREQLGGWSVSK